MSGPARTPNEIKAKRGTLKPSRAVVVQLTNSLPRASELGVPDGLGPIATEAWHRIVEYAGAWIAVSDRDALTLLVKGAALRRRSDPLHRQGLCLRTSRRRDEDKHWGEY
jgi:hypothetical protein